MLVKDRFLHVRVVWNLHQLVMTKLNDDFIFWNDEAELCLFQSIFTSVGQAELNSLHIPYPPGLFVQILVHFSRFLHMKCIFHA